MQRSVLMIAALLALLVGYVELRVPVPVGAQGGDAVYRSLRVETPIEPRYLGTGTPEIWNYLRGDGVWAGVSPPTSVAWRTASLSTTSSSYISTGISLTLDLPSDTSDVLLNARIYQTSSCLGRIINGSTALIVANTLVGTLPLEYTVVHHDPGVGPQMYSFEIRRVSGTCQMNSGSSGTGGISVMIGQVLR